MNKMSQGQPWEMMMENNLMTKILGTRPMSNSKNVVESHIHERPSTSSPSPSPMEEEDAGYADTGERDSLF